MSSGLCLLSGYLQMLLWDDDSSLPCSSFPGEDPQHSEIYKQTLKCDQQRDSVCSKGCVPQWNSFQIQIYQVVVYGQSNLTEFENTLTTAEVDLQRVVLLKDAVLQFLNYSFLRNNFSHTHWQLSCQWWSFTSLHLPDLEVKVWELLPLQSVVFLPEINKGYNICSFILLLLPHNIEGRLREKTFIFFPPHSCT